MAQDALKIDPQINEEIDRQKAERFSLVNEEIDRQKAERYAAANEEIDHQKRLRNGDYDVTTIPGAGQALVGVAENIATMVTGFFVGGVAGTVRGVGDAIFRDGDPLDNFVQGFESSSSFGTYEPKTQKGKRYQGVVQDVYNEYINEKWGGHVEKMLDEGLISPAEAAYYKVSADALALLIPLKAGQWAYKAGGRAAELSSKSNKIVDIDAEVAPDVPRIGRDAIEGELIPADRGAIPDTPSQVELQKRLPGPPRRLMAPEDIPVAVAVRGALERGANPRQIQDVSDSENMESVIDSLDTLYHGSPAKFNEFSIESAGSGAYGHGINLSRSPDVAQTYTGGTEGNMYEVSIPKSATDSFMDQSLPLADQPSVVERLRSLVTDESPLTKETKSKLSEAIESTEATGEDVVEILGVDKEGSALLLHAGISGTKFSAGTENIVLFDETLISRVSRNGEPVYENPASSAQNIFRNRQAGAIDPEVFREGAAIILRPGITTAKMAADLSHALARQIAFKHVTDIRKINSPTAKMLADRIMPLEDSKIPLGGGFHELISLKEGEYSSRLERILEPLRKHVINANASKTLRLIALPKRVNDGIFKGLDTGKVPEKLVPAVKAIRGILNEILEYQQAAGVEVRQLPNYAPHMWDAKKISKAEFGRKKGGAFTKYLMEEEGLSFNVAQEVIATLTHEEGFLDFIEDTGGRLKEGQDYSEWSGRIMRVGGGAARPGHTQPRVLKGNFDTAKEWLVTDVESVLTSYINRAVKHAEYTRITGPNEVTLNQTVRQIIEEQQVSGHEGGKLRANSPHTTAQEIYDVFDALQNRFHQIKTPSVRRASRALAGFEVIHKLSLVALAQFPETMMPAAKYRVATATKALPGIPIPLKSYAVGMADSIINALSSISKIATGTRLIPKTEMRAHLERIGVIYVSALQSSATRMAGTTGIITNRAIRAFQMETITNLQRTVALDTIQSMIRENARYLAKGLAQGTKAKMYAQELVELGIDPKEAVAWYRDGMPKDHPINKKFDIAYVRGLDTTIIMPKAANAPRLYNDPRMQLPLIFTRFFTVFGNTVMKHLGKKLVSGDVTNVRKLASIGSLLAAIGIAYYTQFLREEITGYKYRDEDDPMRVVDAFDRSGLTAMFTRLYPLLSQYKYGHGSQFVAGILGGPLAYDVAGAIEAAQGSDKQKAKYLAKMTPIMTVTPESEEIMYEFYLELIQAMD